MTPVPILGQLAAMQLSLGDALEPRSLEEYASPQHASVR